MRNARYIGRIGASSAALGIGATATGGDHNKAFVTGDHTSASATATSAPPPVSPATPARPPRGQLGHMACAGNGSLRYEAAA
jgi:hypothetical protein